MGGGGTLSPCLSAAIGYEVFTCLKWSVSPEFRRQALDRRPHQISFAGSLRQTRFISQILWELSRGETSSSDSNAAWWSDMSRELSSCCWSMNTGWTYDSSLTSKWQLDEYVRIYSFYNNHWETCTSLPPVHVCPQSIDGQGTCRKVLTGVLCHVQWTYWY